jgi:hypothetical protein
MDILIWIYFISSGLVATMDYLRYGGQVGILRCFLLSLSFPLFLASLILSFIYGFFGIFYITTARYVNFSAEEFDLNEEKSDNDLQ